MLIFGIEPKFQENASDKFKQTGKQQTTVKKAINGWKPFAKVT